MQSERLSLSILVLILSIFSAPALAIGGAGCATPSLQNSPLLRAAVEGTPQDIQREIETIADRDDESRDIKTPRWFFMSEKSRAEWRSRRRAEITPIKRAEIINSPVYCSAGEWLLDYAVAAGNVSVVRWLLDAGANPNAESSGENIFTRCISNPKESGVENSLANSQTTAKRFEALDLVISRGGDLKGSYSALYKCKKPELISFYISRGADLSPPTKYRTKYSPLQYAIESALFGRMWDKGMERTKVFAESGANDIRGLRVESTLRKNCNKPEHRAACSEIAKFVKSSPGTFPSIEYKTKFGRIDESEFSSYRDVCEFPELDFIRDFSAVAVVPIKVWLLPKTGVNLDRSSGEAVQVNVVVNSPSKPIYILVQYGSGSIIWNFSRTRDTRILAVAVSNNSDSPHLIAGLDKSTLIVGDVWHTGSGCGGVSEDQKSPPRAYDGDGEDRLNPFLKKLDYTYFVSGSTVYIGEPIKEGEELLHSSTFNTADSYRKNENPYIERIGAKQK